eukprot:4276561-Prymnesium_polylepis.1
MPRHGRAARTARAAVNAGYTLVAAAGVQILRRDGGAVVARQEDARRQRRPLRDDRVRRGGRGRTRARRDMRCPVRGDSSRGGAP